MKPRALQAGVEALRSVERFEDISPHHLAELLLAHVEDYAIYLLDPGGHVVSWNPGAQRIKGYEAREIVGEHYSVFFTEEDRRAGEPDKELAKAIAGGVQTEQWRVRRDGSRFWASIVLRPIFNVEGKLIAFAKVTRDLSERRQREEERVQHARAEETLRLRNDFVAHAQQALDQTLVTVRVHLESLRAVTEGAGESSPALTSKLTMLEWGLDRLAQSVSRVLQIATDTSARLELEAADRAPLLKTEDTRG